MPDKTTYVSDGRAPENPKALLIIEKYEGLPIFMWSGYVSGYSVRLYPRGIYGKRMPDGRKRQPFTMSLFDIRRE